MLNHNIFYPRLQIFYRPNSYPLNLFMSMSLLTQRIRSNLRYNLRPNPTQIPAETPKQNRRQINDIDFPNTARSLIGLDNCQEDTDLAYEDVTTESSRSTAYTGSIPSTPSDTDLFGYTARPPRPVLAEPAGYTDSSPEPALTEYSGRSPVSDFAEDPGRSPVRNPTPPLLTAKRHQPHHAENTAKRPTYLDNPLFSARRTAHQVGGERSEHSVSERRSSTGSSMDLAVKFHGAHTLEALIPQKPKRKRKRRPKPRFSNDEQAKRQHRDDD